MMVRTIGAVLAAAVALVGCGGSPTSPSAGTTIQTAVAVPVASQPAPQVEPVPTQAPVPDPVPVPAPEPPKPDRPAPEPPAPSPQLPAPGPVPAASVPYYAKVDGEVWYAARLLPAGGFVVEWYPDRIEFGYVTWAVLDPRCDGRQAGGCIFLLTDPANPYNHTATLSLNSPDGKTWNWAVNGINGQAYGSLVRR